MRDKFTKSAKLKEIKREKHLINAEGMHLGRLATQVARILRGKNKPSYTPHMDCGDLVTIYNAEKVKVTGSKEKQKIYFTHSLYPGGHKMLTYEQKKARDPKKIIYLAVMGMLPRNRVGETMLKKMTIQIGELKVKEGSQ